MKKYFLLKAGMISTLFFAAGFIVFNNKKQEYVCDGLCENGLNINEESRRYIEVNPDICISKVQRITDICSCNNLKKYGG